jgi:hypothetical protein
MVHESTSPQGPNPIWETVPRPLTQIPFFYPPPGIEAFQVAATLTLPNMVLAIPVWYLHPPEMVPRPQAGLPMTIPVDPDLCRNTMKYRNTHKRRDAAEIRLHFINNK